MSGKPVRALSDATLKAILERRERDERGDVPSPEELLSSDDLRYLTPPDLHFLIKRIESMPPADKRDVDKVEKVHKRAILDLLRSSIPLGRIMRDSVADELARLWWPDPEAEKRAHRQMKAYVMRADLEVAIAENRRKGSTETPVKKAKDEVAKHWKLHSGEALRKALQPNRVNRRPSRRPSR